jgi:hypothetical protein
MTDRIIRIAGASACENDCSIAVPQLLSRGGRLDFMMFDELAEVNVANLAGGAARNTGIAADAVGYVKSFVEHQVAPYLPEILGRGVRLLANAGGVNPRACAEALAERAQAVGLNPKIAWIDGDNLIGRVDEIVGAASAELTSGVSLKQVLAEADRPLTMLAYIGALPYARALDEGADIVIAGRAADSAAALGALIHSFGWSPADFDKMAAGSLVGHLIECSLQVTGGVSTDWRDTPDWSSPGYPIAECSADGSAVITLAEGSGGRVSAGAVAEQLLYEVGDPQAYILPDVICDFSDVRIEQEAPNRVRVSGAKGRAPTTTYKAQTTVERGWRASVLAPIIANEAVAKAERVASSLFDLVRRLMREANLAEPDALESQLLGVGDALGAQADPAARAAAREVVLRLICDHPDRAGAELFLREQAIINIGMAAGTAMPLGHAFHPIVRLRSFLVEKAAVPVAVMIDGRAIPVEIPAGQPFDLSDIARPAEPTLPETSDRDVAVPLIALARGRSGDKGDLGLVSVIAREPPFLPYIGRALTREAVAQFLAHQFPKGSAAKVDRYFSPGPGAFNYVLHQALGGGQIESRRLDPMGKSLAQQLLTFPVPVSPEIAQVAVRGRPL